MSAKKSENTTEASATMADAANAIIDKQNARIAELEHALETVLNENKQLIDENHALKDIIEQQDNAIHNTQDTSEFDNETLAIKLKAKGITLVIIDGQRYGTYNASVAGTPITDVPEEKLKEILELDGSDFFFPVN